MCGVPLLIGNPVIRSLRLVEFLVMGESVHELDDDHEVGEALKLDSIKHTKEHAAKARLIEKYIDVFA